MKQKIEFEVSGLTGIAHTDTGPKRIFTWIVTCKECSQMLGTADTPDTAQTLIDNHTKAAHQPAKTNMTPGPKKQKPQTTDCPIQEERIVETGEHHGYQWVIAKAPLYGLNGYIRLPETQPNHPWETKEDLCDTEGYLWGEVTFNHGRWYGFDNMHSWNHWQEEYVWEKTPGIIKLARNAYYREPKNWDTLNTTRQQVMQMIEQANAEYTQQTTTGTYTI